MPVECRETTLHGTLYLRTEAFPDERGAFMRGYSRDAYRALGIGDDFVEDNLSFSRRGVLRGLHGDPEMSKLVQVLRGSVFDVVVDARPDSPTFKKWEAFELSGENRAQVYIPKGCLHGFLALTDDVIFTYKQSASYDPSRELNVRWNDPSLAISWPLEEEPILSAKDRAAGSFEQLRRGAGAVGE